MSNLQSKRFVVRKSLIGKNQIIEVTFKNGKTFTYNHDIVYDLMKSKLETMNCFIKYKSYTSSTSVPVVLLSTIDELYQYLNGNVTTEALKDTLEDCQLALDGHFINK